MAVKYSKIGRFLPISHILRFGEIYYDCHAIFIVLANWPLVGRGRVGSNGPVPIFGVLSRLKVRDRRQSSRQRGVLILKGFDASLLKADNPWLDEDFFPDNLVNLFGWRFRLGARLIFIAIFNCWSSGQLESFVRVVWCFFLVVLLCVEERRALLVVFCRCGFC